MAKAPTLPLELTRIATRERVLRAGCTVCHRGSARWSSANAQALAAQHHDRTGHETWCEIALSIRYGRAAPDARQTDIEDAIAASSSGASRKPPPSPIPTHPRKPARM